MVDPPDSRRVDIDSIPPVFIHDFGIAGDDLHIRCDGSRVNGFRRGSGYLQPDDERRVNLPIRIPARVPADLLDCPMGLELLVTDGANSGDVYSAADSFTIHAD